MHATSTQALADHRTAAKAALAAIIFSAGVAFGAVVGTTVASVAPETVAGAGLDVEAPWVPKQGDGDRAGAAANRDVEAPWVPMYGDGDRGGDAANRDVRDQDPRHPGTGGP
jgi:hypothetical protein